MTLITTPKINKASTATSASYLDDMRQMPVFSCKCFHAFNIITDTLLKLVDVVKFAATVRLLGRSITNIQCTCNCIAKGYT